MQDAALEKALLRAIAETLRPFARQLIAMRVPSARVEALVRRTIVEVARDEFALPGKPQTDSRIAVLTGVHRKEVRRLAAGGGEPPPRALGRDLAASLVGRWLADRRATDRRGRPIPIPFRAKKGPSFVALARATTSDLRPKSILDELVRTGAIERRGPNLVALRTDAYVPVADVEQKIAMLAEDPAELAEAMRRNIFDVGAENFFQRKVSFDNLGSEAMKDVRKKLAKIGERTIREANRLLARHDRDFNRRAPGGERTYASMGIYYYEAPTEDPKRPRAERGKRARRRSRENRS